VKYWLLSKPTVNKTKNTIFHSTFNTLSGSKVCDLIIPLAFLMTCILCRNTRKLIQITDDQQTFDSALPVSLNVRKTQTSHYGIDFLFDRCTKCNQVQALLGNGTDFNLISVELNDNLCNVGRRHKSNLLLQATHYC